MKRTLTVAALAAALLATRPAGIVPTAHADNTRDAYEVVSCTFGYRSISGEHGQYGLDPAMTPAERASIEDGVMTFVLVELAALHHKEYAPYPTRPTSVRPADLEGWRCAWERLRP